MTRVLLVEDHPVLAGGLRGLLTDAGFEVVGVAAGVEEAVAAARAVPVDVMLTDYQLGDGTGAEALERIRSASPATVGVFFSAFDDDATVSAAVAAGAAGYLSKTDGPDRVVDAVRRAARGEVLLPAERLARLLSHRHQAERAAADRARLESLLTPREAEVLRLMAAGRTNSQIARELHVAYTTIRAHVRTTISKLDAHSRLEAVARGAELGLV